ncbi:MAG: hypothetical protein COA80_15600 [Leeuwenhoekiella sp.]|nr:MAG: hypothetical protein COA80_15600 [Leeuwenhoekiella sp.]
MNLNKAKVTEIHYIRKDFSQELGLQLRGGGGKLKIRNRKYEIGNAEFRVQNEEFWRTHSMAVANICRKFVSKAKQRLEN